MIVEGAISVKAVLSSKWRSVQEVIIEKGKHSQDISYITTLCRSKHVPVHYVEKDEIEQLATGKSHGGVLGQCSERKFQSVVSLLKNENPFLVLIEGVEDSFNLGYILRTLYAFGCDGVIVNHQFDFNDATMVKSSAGASELLPIHVSENLEETLNLLKNHNFKVISAYRGGNCIDLYEADLSPKPILICVGGPRRGLSRIVLDLSDQFVYIPYANDFRNALNAASAVSVIASEVYRNRRV